MTRPCNLTLLIIISTVTVGCATAPTSPVSTAPTSATAGNTTIVAIAPPARASYSVFDLLGVQQIAACTHSVRDRIAGKLGMVYPGLEPHPPVLLITDPANLSADAPPAVQTAAEIKQKEDQAAQKIKAIRYLATIGCGGCYAGVEDAFLKSLEDCTEEVRYETVLALRETVGRECGFCRDKACCSAKIQKKLFEMTQMDANGCYSEPSARVRRQARLALRQCGPVIPGTVEPVDNESGDDNGESVLEGPSSEELPEQQNKEDVEEGAAPAPVIDAAYTHGYPLSYIRTLPPLQ